MQTTRRTWLHGALAAAATCALPPIGVRAQAAPVTTKVIPSSGEQIPAVGLGSWVTFNVGNDQPLLDECAAVIAAFFEAGGRMIDSSPMYGSSQPTIGYGLKKLAFPQKLFAAEKVWTSSATAGPGQIEESRAYWGVPRFDLLQVHNLLTWERHLETLKGMKAAGKLRYVGVTTSHGRRHEDIEKIIAAGGIDFVQVTYNMADREAADRILPMARERGIAVIINRPYRRGELIEHYAPRPLPSWVAETGAATWPQFLLKYVISHPGVTCAIPATANVAHVRENLGAATGAMPDEAMRKRMLDYVRQI